MPPPRNSGNECCRSRCCCSTIFTVGFTCLTTWIILVTAHAPRLSILFLHVPPLNISSTTTSGQNATLLSFHLKLDNPNLGLGIHYRNLTTSFHYPPNQSSTIADVIVPGFYQGHHKKAVKTGSGETRGVNWTEVAAGLNGTAPAIRVHVNGSVRYKFFWWRRTSRVNVEGVAGVDSQGVYAAKNGVRLKSGATTSRLPQMGRCLPLLLVLLVITGFLY